MAKTKEEKLAAKRLRSKLRRQIRSRDVKIDELYLDHPIEEWDDEELARGRPRAIDGTFRGVGPQWVSRKTHEEAVRIFTEQSQGKLRGLVPVSLTLVEKILTSDEVDEKGKPVIPASVQLDAAKWVTEHLVGKPTQRTETDISVRLQGILANVIVGVSSGDPESGSVLELGPGDYWDDEDDESSSASD